MQPPRGHQSCAKLLLQVATLVKADWLFLLTDVDGLYTANPATHPEALRIPEVHDITKLQVISTGSGILRQLSGSEMYYNEQCPLPTWDFCTQKHPQSQHDGELPQWCSV